MRLPIMCNGPCNSPPLGFIDLPDGTMPRRAAAAQSGYLCDECAAVYRILMAQGDHLPWLPPTAEDVAKHGTHGRGA